MPSRILRDSYATSESVASMSPGAQDRLPRYFLLADDYGCFAANNAVMRGRVFPLRPDITDEIVASDMAEYEQAGIVATWTENGRKYAHFPNWLRHQREPRATAKRKTPAPPHTLPGTAGHFSPQSQSQASIAVAEKPRGRPPGDPRHRPAVDLFCRLWLELRQGDKYDVKPKDTANLSSFLKSHQGITLEEMERRMRMAFTTDKLFAQNGSLAWFLSRWVNYDRVVALVSQQPARREAVGFDNATGEVIFK